MLNYLRRETHEIVPAHSGMKKCKLNDGWQQNLPYSPYTKNKEGVYVPCPFYRVWLSMRNRCVSSVYKTKRPTYEIVTCCEDWKSSLNFKLWMQDQDWDGKCLDKDLLVVGNKLYSPETCLFISTVVNSFITDSKATRGDTLVGTSRKKNGKFQSRCSNPFSKKVEHLGTFDDEMIAHLVWKKRKNELAWMLAELETDSRVKHALQTRYIL